MGTLNRYLILMINTCSGFSSSHQVVAAIASDLTIEILPLTLVSGEK